MYLALQCVAFVWACGKGQPFLWRTSENLTCDAGCDGGISCRTDLSCNVPPGGNQCDNLAASGHSLHPCWGLMVLDPPGIPATDRRTAPEVDLGEGAVGVCAECCCDHDWCSAQLFPVLCSPAPCIANEEPPPAPYQCRSGHVYEVAP